MSHKFWKKFRRRGGQVIRGTWAAITVGILLYYLTLGLLVSGLLPAVVSKFYTDLSLKPEVTVGDTATIFLALVGLAALLVAGYQLQGLTRQTRATVLMSLDERWERREMEDLRLVLAAFRREVNGQATVLPDDGRFARELERLRNCPPGSKERLKYDRLFQLCGFFETLGYSVKAGYISLTDVYGLLAGAIDAIGEVICQHLRDRQIALKDDEFYGYNVWLVEQVKKRRELES